jgi:hypothetical protein
MRKLLLLLLVPFFSGCTCMLSQVPPQYVIAGINCTAPLPDYKTKVIVTGGCTGFMVTQTPNPGFVLSLNNKSVLVTVKATGTNNKSSQVSFTVNLIDTVTPIITPLPELLTYKLKQINDVYDIADNMLIGVEKSFGDKMLMITSMDSANIRKRVIINIDSLDIPIYNWK